jgi:hypothetical protein
MGTSVELGLVLGTISKFELKYVWVVTNSSGIKHRSIMNVQGVFTFYLSHF